MLAAVVELLGDFGLVIGEPGPAAAFAAPGTGGGQAVAGVGNDQFSLQFGEHGQHVEHGPPFHGGRVDALLDDLKSDAAFTELCAEDDEVDHGAAEPVEAGNDRVSPSHSSLRTRSSFGRLAFAPLATSV